MIEINKDRLEARVLKTLMKKYPVTASELRKILGVREHTLKNSLTELARAGIIGLEPLPDKVFIRLLREDISFVGVRPKQKRGIVKEAEKRKAAEYGGMMFR